MQEATGSSAADEADEADHLQLKQRATLIAKHFERFGLIVIMNTRKMLQDTASF